MTIPLNYLDSKKAKEIIIKRLEDNKWWVFTTNSTMGLNIVSQIERTFYEGADNDLWGMVVISEEEIGLEDGRGDDHIVIAMCKKEALSEYQLSEQLMVPAEACQERDHFLLCLTEEEGDNLWRKIDDWLEGE